MSLKASPDPKRSSGGYARLSGTIAETEVWVTVYNSFSERYLGQTDWQAAKVEFGPYQVEREGDESFIVIGPEIVNRLVENSDVRFQLGSLGADVLWPETISQRPGAAVIGGLRTLEGVSVAQAAQQRVTQLPEDIVAPAALTALAAPPAPSTDETPSPTIVAPSRKPLLVTSIGALLVLLGGAGFAWFFLWEPQSQHPPVAQPVTETAEPDGHNEVGPDPVNSACGSEILATLSTAVFADALATISICANEFSADQTLAVLENRSAADDADALFAFGQLYDPSQTNEIIEDSIGLTFGDSPGVAAEYYARAAEQGSEIAGSALIATCDRLSDRADTLSESAFQEYCV